MRHWTLGLQVHVLPPKQIAFLPSPVEAEVGHVLQLPLAVYADISMLSLVRLRRSSFTSHK